MIDRDSTMCGADGHCITCSDEGVPMRVAGPPFSGLALCADAAGRESEVEVSLVDCVVPGDLLLVHAGVAIARLTAGAAP